MFNSDDPILDYDRYLDDKEQKLEELPECVECGEQITDEYAYYINDEWICESCMDRYRKEVIV